MGLSSAITCTPLACSFFTVGMMASPLEVMRMVLAPAEAMFSSAAIWPAVSPSDLPAALSSLAPAFCASACAPSFIFTKNGLLSVLVIRPMTGWAPWAKAAEAAKARVARARPRGRACMEGLLYVGQRTDYSGCGLIKSSCFSYGKP
jgi:hypothetical protein